jgi:DNA uptake protein ComE-like DNA-binding protein
MRSLNYLCLLMVALLIGLVACSSNQSSEDIKEKTAQATAEIKQGAKAVAEGVREGWSRDKPLNLNTATKEDLLKLPGITPAQADRIIAGRPYDDPKDLVTRRILPKTEYDKISDRLTAKKQS